MSNDQNNTNTYGTKSNALRALRKIGPNLEELVEQLEDGRWTFDVADAKALANLDRDGDHTPDLDEVKTKQESPMSNETPSATFSLADALAEEQKMNAADAAAGKPAPKKGESDEEKAAKAEAKRVKAEAAAAEKAAKAQAKKEKSDAAAAEKAAEKAKASQEREDRAAAKKAEKDASKKARELKAAEKEAAKKAREDKKAKSAQDKLDAELARKEAKALAREARASTIKNGIRLPGANSKLGKLWSLIEGLTEAADGQFPTFQDFKAATEHMSYDDKGGPATVTTAYYDYRMYHGVTGRIVAPKPEVEAPVEPGAVTEG